MSDVYACVLAEVESGKTFEAANQLSLLESVGLVVPTTGPYDLLIIARAKDPADLGKTVITDIQEVEGVLSTLTLLILGSLELKGWLQKQAIAAQMP